MDSHGLSKRSREGKEATFDEIGQGGSSEAERTIFKETGQGSSSEAEQTVFKKTGKPLYGLMLLEVFSFTVSQAANRTSCNIYGTIFAEDDFCHHTDPLCLYDGSRDNSELIDNGGKITLVGPKRAIVADRHAFEVVLYHKDDCDFIDKEIASGRLFAEMREENDKRYQCPTAHEFLGFHGKATINYTIFKNAVAAYVKLTFIGNEVENVYGTVSAFTSLIPDHEVVLFLAYRSHPVSFHNEESIKLLRSVVVVPFESALFIVERLNSCSDLSNKSGENKIAKFPVQFSRGTSESNIKCRGGRLHVVIEWKIY